MTGTCEHCGEQFGIEIFHSGFAEISYAYCDKWEDSHSIVLEQILATRHAQGNGCVALPTAYRLIHDVLACLCRNSCRINGSLWPAPCIVTCAA